MASTSTKTPLLLGLLAVILLAGGGYGAYIKYTDFESAQAKEKVLQAEKAEIESSIESLSVTMTNYEAIKENAEKINDVLPTKEQVPELLYQLEAIAEKEAGVSFAGVSFANSAEQQNEESTQELPSGVHTMNVAVQIHGTYPGLKRYLDAIEQNIRIIDVTSVQFSGAYQLDESPDLFEYQISMNAYYVEK
ncbi:type 4a pilus biogenesis protein PilO [Patescibacteria group bacterium]|nr:type 4a pilus biogenesis protein PilO [Patescibacteria group bacterium]